MLPDWELWAAAVHVRDRHGDRAALVIAERLGDLASKGDVEGVAAWKAIADRIDRSTQDRAIQPH